MSKKQLKDMLDKSHGSLSHVLISLRCQLKCHLLIRSNLTTMKIFNLSTVFPISLTVLSFSPNIYRLLVLKKNYLIGLLFMVCLCILQWIFYKGRDFWELSSVMFPPLIVLCLAHGSHSIRICYMKPETDSQT